MTTKPKPHAGALLYKRKSTVELERRSLGEQDTAGRELAARLGLPVVADVIEEASAYAERERPKFTAALQRAAAERLVIITWSIDRFSRRGAEAVLPLLKADSPLRLVTVDGDDTADERQRLIIIIKAEMALQYSQQLGRNVKRARASARASGLWAGGNAPYGYQVAGTGRNRRLVIDEAEAGVVRELAAGVLSGAPVGRLAADLNRRGIPGPTGKAWRHMTVKRTLLTPSVAGWLPLGDDVVRDPDNQPVEAHEPILPVDEWERLQALLKWEKRPGGRPTKSLLAGILRCCCGGPMTRNVDFYSCANRSRGDGRRHVTIQETTANRLVTDLVLGRLIWLGTLDPEHESVRAVAEAWGQLVGDDSEHDERLRREDAVDTARVRLQRTARLVAEGHLDESQAAGLLAEYRQAVAAAEARLSELGPSRVEISSLLDMTRPQWEALALPRQRTILRAVLRSVDVLPEKGNRQPRRLAAHWVT